MVWATIEPVGHHSLIPPIAGRADDMPKARVTPYSPRVLPAPLVACQAQLDPTELSVLNMLLPAV